MIWKPIPSYPDYEASEEGQVRRRYPGERQKSVTVLTQKVQPNGYIKVRLWVDDKGKNVWLQRLVCEAFHGLPPTPKHQAAHADGIRANCAASNLSWKTRKENYQDSIRHGTSKRGEGNSMAKLRPEQVLAIRESKTPSPALANQYGITASAIRAIKRKQLWPHL